ncbi:TonB-dependent Receptor Plug Domain [Tenacibaculum sp. MAR_2009_124]|uniref:TonB-dependent receptor n=1 Tax=Tenacibaculum sp. MAR_2009_124 TaxID=1250059 RepID=UPI00089C0526|nr:TonB-dependent receptor [Tenacibaculum sp. MAR_2009_124]SEC29611.1 TonB-dependent Receptor Plug Domain [Tenacibaculum sp. MAR_2009_124]
MKNFRTTVVMLFCVCVSVKSQNVLKGIVLKENSEEPLQEVFVGIKELNLSRTTKSDGSFILEKIPNGNYDITVALQGYETQNYPVQFLGETIDLGIILLYEDISEDQDLSIITIADDELNDDTSIADNITGLLQSSEDLYLRTAAFEWGSSFFRVRGLDSENGKVLINGVEMNKFYNGRPQWSNWGGLNDVMRNQEFTSGLTPSSYDFGGALGTTNINTRASEYSKGIRISYASSNRSYVHRVIGTYTSGLSKNGWAFAISGGRRAGNEGYVNGTFYDANSMFLSVEKVINDRHSINASLIAAANKRGKSAPNTQEVFDLKGSKYNPYWGFQNGKVRNSRVKDLFEPIIMLNHYWSVSENTRLNTNFSYQIGRIGNSRINFNGTRLVNGWPIGGGSNPDPTYYQKLPSFALRNGTGMEYDLLQEFLDNGQWNWDEMIRQNLTGIESTNSKYILYEDRNDEDQFSINTIFSSQLNNNITLNGKVQFRQVKSENFANVIDLLGGDGFLDIDTFGDDLTSKQNDVRNPNRLVTTGDRFGYNYIFNSSMYSAFLQGQFTYKKVDFYIAGNVSKSNHQREGLYQNGSYVDNSFGESEKMGFTNFSIKTGFTSKFLGGHLVDVNGGYITKAPTLRNTFSNPRENNETVNSLSSEKMLSFDTSYIFRSPLLQTKLTGYFIGIKDATEIGFFFADGIGGDNAAFVQEVLTGIEKRHFGLEIGVDLQLTPSTKLKGAANIGQYTYQNNPLIYLTSDAPLPERLQSAQVAYLKNYRIASGPQKAYSIGFEYRDPDYWWLGATVNYLDDTFVDIAPLKRTENFVIDADGVEFFEYDPIIAKRLLAQEEFDSYLIVNAVGGKSWRIGNYYVGFFASINNLFNKEYISGGFEQGRNANYRTSKADEDLSKPIFGNKYWQGRGTTYFMNVYLRF